MADHLAIVCQPNPSERPAHHAHMEEEVVRALTSPMRPPRSEHPTQEGECHSSLPRRVTRIRPRVAPGTPAQGAKSRHPSPRRTCPPRIPPRQDLPRSSGECTIQQPLDRRRSPPEEHSITGLVQHLHRRYPGAVGHLVSAIRRRHCPRHPIVEPDARGQEASARPRPAAGLARGAEARPQRSEDPSPLFGGLRRQPSPLCLQGQQVPWSSNATYIGVVIDRRLNMTGHVRKATQAAKVPLFLLRPLLRSRLPLQTKPSLYNAYVRPHLTYAAPAWFALTSPRQRRILQVVQNLALRRVTQAPSVVRNTTLHRDLRMESLEGHIVRLASNAFRRIRFPRTVTAQEGSYTCLGLFRPTLMTHTW